MARDDIQMNVRLPAELKKQLDEAAARASRSLTAEVVARLADSFQDVEKLLLENRHREAMVIEAELERVKAELAAVPQVVSITDERVIQLQRYQRRLRRYRELISGGIHWITTAGDAPEDETDSLARTAGERRE